MVDFDIAVVGAGLAGLTCAAQLRQAGYRVVVIEKSRGLGGRAASYRLEGHRVDRGLRFVTEENRLLAALVKILRDRNILQGWTDEDWMFDNGELVPARVPLRYAAPEGINAVGKFLAQGTSVWFSRRLTAIAPTGSGWHLRLDPVADGSNAPMELTARAIVSAIPAPQILPCLAQAQVPQHVRDILERVEYNPCITVMAKYPPAAAPPQLPWKSVQFLPDTDLYWVGLDSSKRESDRPLVVVHSSAGFARSHFEAADLTAIAHQLLAQVAQYLGDWLSAPELVRVHRWRYAFPRNSWHQDCLVTTAPHPLVCCGDWCGASQAETALRSGLAAASATNSQLEQRALPPIASVWKDLDE